jgi:hypothetical protein
MNVPKLIAAPAYRDRIARATFIDPPDSDSHGFFSGGIELSSVPV